MPQDEEKTRHEQKTERKEREERRRRFAQALTRDAFGRHYWDEGKAKELRRAVARDRKRKEA